MEETALLAPLLLTIAGLTVGAIFKSLFQRTNQTSSLLNTFPTPSDYLPSD